MLIPAVGIAAGILLDRIAPFTIMEAAALACIFAVLACIPGHIVRRRAAIGLASTALGVLAALHHRPGPPPRIDASASEAVILSGCVVEPSVFSENREQFTLELEPGARARVNLNLRPEQTAPRLRYGQRVEFEGRVRPPHNFGNPGAFDYEGYLARREIFWNISTRTGAEVTLLEGTCGRQWESWLFAIRSAALERLEGLYKTDAYKTIMMQAVLIGENTRMEKAWTEDYRRTGTYHALVISGLHLTVLAGHLLWVFRYSTGQHILSIVLAFFASWTYAAAAGFTAPVVRAAGGFTIFLLTRLWYRQPHLLNSLAVIVTVFLLLDPGQLFEGSFQLSVLSVLAIGALAGPLFEAQTRPTAAALHNLGKDRYDVDLAFNIAALRVESRLIAETLSLYTRIPEKYALAFIGWSIRTGLQLYEIFMLSAIVQVALALPMAMYFHRASLSGMIANVLIVPIMNAVVTIGFVAVLTNLQPLAWVTGLLLDLSRRIAEFFATLEPNWRIPDPPLWLALVFTAALIALALFARRAGAPRWLAFATVIALFAILVAHPFPPQFESGKLEINAIDVGQGDSVLLVSPQGKTLLVDAGGVPGFKGRPKPKLDIGEDVISTYLWTRSIRRVDAVALTHAHEDHSGGLAALIRNFQPAELWVGAMGESEVWKRVRDVARANNVKIVPCHNGDRFDFGGAQIHVLAPFRDQIPEPIARNNDSLVFTATLGQRSFLLTGDAEKEIEYRLVDERQINPIDVLKLGHHGSRTSSTADLLDAAKPQFAIVSAGLDNLYRHPHPDVVARLEQRNVTILRTDLGGQIRFLTNGRHLQIDAFRGLPRRGTPPNMSN